MNRETVTIPHLGKIDSSLNKSFNILMNRDVEPEVKKITRADLESAYDKAVRGADYMENMILTILYEAATRGRRTVSIMYRANMGPINNVEAAFVKLEQDGYNVRRSDQTACSPTWTIGF